MICFISVQAHSLPMQHKGKNKESLFGSSGFFIQIIQEFHPTSN